MRSESNESVRLRPPQTSCVSSYQLRLLPLDLSMMPPSVTHLHHHPFENNHSKFSKRPPHTQRTRSSQFTNGKTLKDLSPLHMFETSPQQRWKGIDHSLLTPQANRHDVTPSQEKGLIFFQT
jgi:hypothetical protein